MDELASVSRMAYAERGETIWLHGNMVDFFGLVGCGFVKMIKSFRDGHEATAEIIGPGQVFGLLGVVDKKGCPLEARAVSQTWYVKIPKASILPIYDQQVIFKDQLVSHTTNRYRQRTDMLMKMSSGRVEQRIAIVILLLSETFAVQANGGLRIEVPLTRQDISEMAGTTVESTIRTMSRWQKEGIIKSENMIVTILDEAALEDHLNS